MGHEQQANTNSRTKGVTICRSMVYKNALHWHGGRKQSGESRANGISRVTIHAHYWRSRYRLLHSQAGHLSPAP
ncbi:MAG: hypothetical protein O3C40_37775, partial [Planctomycetota bacterium]|nr:hypothetical protein [Planctomycetota bacterium]